MELIDSQIKLIRRVCLKMIMMDKKLKKGFYDFLLREMLCFHVTTRGCNIS